jgi:hypothetical protein
MVLVCMGNKDVIGQELFYVYLATGLFITCNKRVYK